MEREIPTDATIFLTGRSLERTRARVMQNLPTPGRLRADRFFDSLPIRLRLKLGHYSWDFEVEGVASNLSAALGLNGMEEEIVRLSFRSRLEQITRRDVTVRMDNIRSAVLKWTAERAGENLDDQAAVENWVSQILNAGQVMGTLFTAEEFDPQGARRTLLSLGEGIRGNRPPEQYLTHDMFIYVYGNQIRKQDRRTGRISSF